MKNNLLESVGKYSLASGLSLKQYQAIGMVVAEWAHLEWTLRYLLQKVGNLTPNLTAKLSARLNAASLMEVVETVAHDEMSDDSNQPLVYQHVRSIWPELDKLRDERNDISHIDWIGNGRGKFEGIKVRANNKLKLRLKKFDTNTVLALAYRIALMNQRVMQLALDFEEKRLEPLPVRSKPKRGR